MPLSDNTAALVIAAILAVLLLLVVLRLARGSTPPPPPRPLPPLTQVEPRLEAPPPAAAPPSPAEAQKRAEAEEARRKAQELAAERERLAREGQQDEARRLKAEVEEARKAAYRADKQAEAEGRERKRLEREEAQRAAEEARQQAQARADAERQAALEAQRQKVAAEAGRTLAAGLARTRQEGFMARLNGLFGGAQAQQLDEKVLGELEEVLFTADIGVKTAQALVELARDKAKSKALSDAQALKALIRAEVQRIVTLPVAHRLAGGGPPHVVMVVGVNGAGKTTTIGKLAARAHAEGRSVVLGAGDTFRAAAAEQLDVWAERAHAHLVKGKDEADPASVAFDAVKEAVQRRADLVLADTAGRLHTKLNLMEELKKVRRVMDKALPGAPHEVLLVLDATNGQNAIHQARQFHDAVGVTGIALTKLDGTAKGGVIIGICDELKVPVLWAGVGEKVSDLRPFEPAEFVEALFQA